jgi:putative PIN family toxin of toxin-antitoxin system
MRRVVPDVQALVQGMISRQGPAGTLLDAWTHHEIELITCAEIVEEFEHVLRRPRIRRKFAHITEEVITTFAAGLRERGVVLAPDDIPRIVPNDPDDDVVLACAAAANAEYVVTRDQHLLSLSTHQGIPIVSTEAFARILRGQVSEALELVYGRAR